MLLLDSTVSSFGWDGMRALSVLVSVHVKVPHDVCVSAEHRSRVGDGCGPLDLDV